MIDQLNREDNRWNVIHTERDAERFLLDFLFFHDAVISGVEYVPNPEPYKRKDGSACWNTSLTIVFFVYSNKNNYDAQSTEEIPDRVKIEVEFKRTHLFHFIPFDEGDCNILSRANIVFSKNTMIWGELPGRYDTRNQYGFTDKKTWIVCEEIRWRNII